MSVTLHTLGLPRIGKKRELKTALEKYWKGRFSAEQLENQASAIRHENWKIQDTNNMSFVNVGDFSLYDHVLDTSFLLGHIPGRFGEAEGSTQLDTYFGVARGLTDRHIEPASMTKWFNTNYHYIVPEINSNSSFAAQPGGLLSQIAEAKDAGYIPKVQLLGPVSYLYLSKTEEEMHPLEVLDRLLTSYTEVLIAVQNAGVEWVQIDEPILVLDTLDTRWREAFAHTYSLLSSAVRISGNNPALKLLLTTYFDSVQEELETILTLPVDGIHLDYQKNSALLTSVVDRLNGNQILSLGVVDGRSPWKEDIGNLADELRLLADKLGSRLWLAPSCSLLHLPWSIEGEEFPENALVYLAGQLRFGVEKLGDLSVLGNAINSKAESQPITEDKYSHDDGLSNRIEEHRDLLNTQRAPFRERKELQKKSLGLPLLPTTSIGSFPQTQDIRKLRSFWKRGDLSDELYTQKIRRIISENIRIQEEIGLDVLVHGEPERSDMVSFFAERLEGVWSSAAGWVQSYGSRCVKPPVIYSSVRRKPDLGVDWISYAQSLTDKPVKGMLTGPVTILKWAFAPQGGSLETAAYDIALAIREEVLELESRGISIIQIDEPAFREVLPLKQGKWPQALDWAARAFRLSHAGVKDITQIHSHMCYSDFNSIFEGIDAMDADVISIETSRSRGELFAELSRRGYAKGLGPGVYDIHSPLIPREDEIRERINRSLEHLNIDDIWVNPDCGLKTRSWDEAKPALEAMVRSARALR